MAEDQQDVTEVSVKTPETDSTEAATAETPGTTAETPAASTEATAAEKPKEPAVADEAASTDAAPADAADAPSETVAETGAKQDDAEAPETPKAEPPKADPKKTFGFTGEIIGEVFKLSDLDSDPKSTTEVSAYKALAELVDSTLTNVSAHEIVTGRVVSLGDKDVVIDIGFKSDGIVARNEFPGELEIGQEVEVYLERIEDYHGQLVLSKTKADKVQRWRRIEVAFEKEEVLEGVIVRRIKGGMIAELFDGVEAFLPGSQIDVRPVRDFDAYLEKRMEFKIVKLNPTNENIVVSHKALIEKDLEKQRESILSTMEPGQILEGLVKNITDFGVFIDLGGVDGLLHITDLSWGRVSHPSELVTLDEKLKVVVLDYDKERQRISLGLKQLQPHPWENIGERYAIDSVVEGKVVSITDYGAFVELEKGIEGLVHISEMSWTEHVKHPSQMVSLGQMVNVKILSIDHDGKKISLGMKQLEPDPWENIIERYPPGTVLRGMVRNITNFGVFVEIEPGIDGLVHISDLSWTKKVRHPGEVVKKGQELDVVVLNIDTDERRISLGHKQVETNPWTHFTEVYAPGTEVEGTVVRTEDGNVVVSLPLDVEATIPNSELKHNSEDGLRKHYPVGEALSGLRIVRCDPGQKEIVASETASQTEAARAKVVEERRVDRTRRDNERSDIREFQKQTQASGPTTLAELSGLEALKSKMEAQEAATAKESAPKAAAKAAEPKADAEADAEADDSAAEDASEGDA